MKNKTKKERIRAIILFSLIIIIPSIVTKNIIGYPHSTFECPEGWICDPVLISPSVYALASAPALLKLQVFFSFLAGFLLLKLITEAKLKDVIGTIILGVVFTFITDLVDYLLYLTVALIICIPFGFMGGYLGRKMRGGESTVK